MSSTAPTTRTTSEQLHNKNCFAYLKNLHINPYIATKLEELDPTLATQLRDLPDRYNPAFGYADLYTRFFTVVEENIVEMDRHATDREAFDDFIRSIYDNNNRILETTFDEIKHIAASQSPIGGSIERQISGHMADTRERSNSIALSPAQAGSAYGRFMAMMSANFKPQHTTSLATVRTYDYQREKPERNPVREYRFGTQGQRHNGMERVSPLFEAWLRSEVRRSSAPAGAAATGTPITHVYINNLGRDRTGMEGKKEQALTMALESLEGKHPNIAVITLPADKGLMSGSDFKKTNNALNVAEVRDEFLKLALEDGRAKTTKDFHISDSIRLKLFGGTTWDAQKPKLNAMLNSSFAAMGLAGATTISSAQRQAVWFHFIKFELPKHILETLQPKSVNFSCKDAIDRGGVSSAYYNLMKSIDDGSPMNREEFDRALHAAPTMVKARGMNHHTKLIWNAVDAYLNNEVNYNRVKADPKQAWLIEWRDLTCPHARVESLLTKRVAQAIEELNKWHNDTTLPERKTAITNSITLLTDIQRQSNLGVSGKRLLLEVVTRTTKLLDPQNTPEAIGRDLSEVERLRRLTDVNENTRRYQTLSDQLSIKYPELQVIICAMKVAVAYVFTLGQAKTWINDGIASIKAAVDVTHRQRIQRQMHDTIGFMKERSRPVPRTAESKEDDVPPEAPTNSA
jgi:hypothetical protein